MTARSSGRERDQERYTMAGVDQSEGTLSEVCEELDDLTLRLMEDLETLEMKRDLLNMMIEKGWLCLSQARYSMGNKFVSSLQYKADMAPSVLVQDSTAEDGRIAFEVERVEKRLPAVVEELGATEQGLRRRKGPPEVQEEARKEAKAALSQDPLRWFGILVPQSLRQAQSSFCEGILFAAEVASLQSSIAETQRQYHTLLAKKQHLLALES